MAETKLYSDANREALPHRLDLMITEEFMMKVDKAIDDPKMIYKV